MSSPIKPSDNISLKLVIPFSFYSMAINMKNICYQSISVIINQTVDLVINKKEFAGV